MKAADIIHELTVNDYDSQVGVITVEKGDAPLNKFFTFFCDGVERIYCPLPTMQTVQDGERNFFYITEAKLYGCDEEIFAILREENDIIYLYEIE